MTFRNPVVNLKVLNNGNLRIGTIMSFILGFGLYGSTFIIPLYTQSILGWTATQAGLLFVPAALTTAFMMPIIGQLLQKGAKQQYLVSLGLLTFFFFCFWGYNILTPDTPKVRFLLAAYITWGSYGTAFYSNNNFIVKHPERQTDWRRRGVHRNDAPIRWIIWGGHHQHFYVKKDNGAPK